MTKLNKPVRREVQSMRFGPLIVTLTAVGVELREKGRRKSFLLPYGVAYQNAVTVAVIDERRERRRTRGRSR